MKRTKGNDMAKKRKPKAFDAREWRLRRISHYQHNLRFAMAARAYRIAYGFTQAEVAVVYDVTDMTISNWETGAYCWKGGAEELEEYQACIRKMASRRDENTQLAKLA